MDNNISDKTQSDSLEDAYLDRNIAVQAFARLAIKQGYNVGTCPDPKEPGYLVLSIDLPTGQVGWHLPNDSLEGTWPEYKKPWDGHVLEEKRQRLISFINQSSTDNSDDNT